MSEKNTHVWRTGDRNVALTYDLVEDWTSPFRHPAQFHRTLMPEYLEFTGDNSLIHPKLPLNANVTVHFDWSGLPSTWVLAKFWCQR